MNWNLDIIIPIALIAFSLIVIIILIIRKFPELVLVDVSTIPEERARELKDKLLAERLQRRVGGFFGRFVKIFKKIFSYFVAIWKLMQNKIEQWERRYRYRYQPVVRGRDMKARVDDLLAKADGLLEKDEFNDAERAYLEVINLDKHNVEAYRGLGKLYYRQKEYGQAKEIFNFALKLILDKKEESDNSYSDSDVAQLYYNLGLIYRATNAKKRELEHFALAVENEENNPKYLDCLVETAVKCQKKDQALEALQKLKEVNPKNTKLETWEEKIDEMSKSEEVKK